MRSVPSQQLTVKIPMVAFAFSCVIFVITLLVICTDHWVRIESGKREEYVGLFYSDTDEARTLSCNANTSNVECGYLMAARYSGIFAVFFSVLTTFGYYQIATNFTMYPLPGFWWMVTACSNLVQSMFTALCGILYYFFTSSYLTQNDDLNVEYSDEGITSTRFEWSFWALVSMAIWASILTAHNLMINSEYYMRQFLKAYPHNVVKNCTVQLNRDNLHERLLSDGVF